MNVLPDATIIGKVFFGSNYVNHSQIFDGMAWYEAEQSIDSDLADAQMAAQDAGRGIWGDPDVEIE